MEWPNDKALLFINEIKNLPVLWDSSDPYYKISRKKNETWEDLANKFGTTIVDVKKKWLSLQASYRRERLKVIDSEKGKKIKLTKWFAYHAMMFLEDHYKPRGSRNNSETSEEYQQQEEDSDPLDLEDINKMELTCPKVENTLHEPERNLRLRNISFRKKQLKVFHSKLITPKKRKINEDNKPSEMYILKAITEKESQRDETETYGEYVALTLKKLDNYSRIMAKHYINEILIEAELGKYKDSVPQRSSTPTTYSAISPSLSAYSYQSGGSNNVVSSEPNL
ncbi:transcription factor Adf-1 [Solenopsis invicta]|uniref:transcription factor Adf-1 n=1 Tax=Solenopsis invicta TaxID=13686 RepID=UPI0005960E2A|nr:transcription factor Adf-1 [Solenopsis invicta]